MKICYSELLFGHNADCIFAARVELRDGPAKLLPTPPRILLVGVNCGVDSLNYFYKKNSLKNFRCENFRSMYYCH